MITDRLPRYDSVRAEYLLTGRVRIAVSKRLPPSVAGGKIDGARNEKDEILD